MSKLVDSLNNDNGSYEVGKVDISEKSDTRPIGVFDSGLGGLTIVKNLMKLLPNENIVYFGDTGRVPYGTRSIKTIERYTKQDCEFLLSKNVKMIIAACGTASSVAPHVFENLDNGIPALGVVLPACKSAVEQSKNGKIGVLATVATVRANAFAKRITELNEKVEVLNQACSLFIPLVENGWIAPDDEVTNLTAERYLKPLNEYGVDTIILGCTHFPMIKKNISRVVGKGVKLIDIGKTTAKACAEKLLEIGALNQSGQLGDASFYVSDQPDDFSRVASMFLGREINSDIKVVELGS